MFRCSCSQIPNSISLARALFIPKKERLLLRIYNNVFNRRLFRGRDLTPGLFPVSPVYDLTAIGTPLSLALQEGFYWNNYK